MQEVLLFATVIAPVILALVEVIKKTVRFPSNYVPVVAIIVGLVVGWAAEPFTDLGLNLRLWAGALAALSSTGLFELVKTRPGMTK